MRRICLFVLIMIVLLGTWMCLKTIVKAEDTQMQTIIKTDPVTNDKIEFRLKLYTLENLKTLIPSVDSSNDPNAKHDKYLFCTIKNLSERNAIYIKFKVLGKHPNTNLHSPEIVMTWLPPSGNLQHGQQYNLIRLGNLYTVDSLDKIEFDVEIIQLQRK